MNHITCDIILDLLPLYADEACSEDSRTLVEEHISHCPECGKLLRDMYAPLDTAPPELDGKAVLSSLKKNLLGI